jgi:hypothetical protein
MPQILTFFLLIKFQKRGIIDNKIINKVIFAEGYGRIFKEFKEELVNELFIYNFKKEFAFENMKDKILSKK